MDRKKVMHILRNPYGWTDEETRAAALAAADMLEECQHGCVGVPVLKEFIERYQWYSDGFAVVCRLSGLVNNLLKKK